MKKFLLCLISAISITSFLHAQSFEKGGKYLSLGIGGTNFGILAPESGLELALPTHPSQDK